MQTWKDFKEELKLTEEEKVLITMEKQLIEEMIRLREEKGLTQSQLAEMCNVKQPVIARMERDAHSPQVDSLLKVLVPMGYMLQIVPIDNDMKMT